MKERSYRHFREVRPIAALACDEAWHQRGFASGMVETTRQLGHSLGVSISSGVLQTSLAGAAIPAAILLGGLRARPSRLPC